MRNQEEGGVVYYNCFQGSQLIDWLIGNGDFSTRQEAIAECRRMLENEVLRHGKLRVVTQGQIEFKDAERLMIKKRLKDNSIEVQ